MISQLAGPLKGRLSAGKKGCHDSRGSSLPRLPAKPWQAGAKNQQAGKTKANFATAKKNTQPYFEIAMTQHRHTTETGNDMSTACQCHAQKHQNNAFINRPAPCHGSCHAYASLVKKKLEANG